MQYRLRLPWNKNYGISFRDLIGQLEEKGSLNREVIKGENRILLCRGANRVSMDETVKKIDLDKERAS